MLVVWISAIAVSESLDKGIQKVDGKKRKKTNKQNSNDLSWGPHIQEHSYDYDIKSETFY